MTAHPLVVCVLPNALVVYVLRRVYIVLQWLMCCVAMTVYLATVSMCFAATIVCCAAMTYVSHSDSCVLSGAATC